MLHLIDINKLNLNIDSLLVSHEAFNYLWQQQPMRQEEINNSLFPVYSRWWTVDEVLAACLLDGRLMLDQYWKG